ncbi:MAG: HutD family protein [Rhizobacter sp.]|nr:HutD family protein [Rhizobacter sp.]
MTLTIARTQDMPPQPWRNGGGVTRELLAWPPEAEPWLLRVSVAEIDSDGPFSAFPDVQRWFTVLDGAGVVLSFADGERRVSASDAPLPFDGAAAPGCRLVKGPTRDLNLMLRGGQGFMRPVDRGVSWEAGFALRGLYTASPGRWRADSQSHTLDAHTLLWCDDGKASVWSFEPQGPQPRAWWFAYTAVRPAGAANGSHR